MASAAEQMAANLSWSAFGKAKDLQNRILFTLGLLIVYRLGTFIPIPGIDQDMLRQFVEQTSGGILGIANMFTGNALAGWRSSRSASCPTSRPRSSCSWRPPWCRRSSS
jgi:preprotein translocase subunit SecY